MSLNEILKELDHLTLDELNLIQEKLDLLRENEDFEETPEMLAAIDEGLRSLREEGTISIEQLRAEMRTWTLENLPKDEA